MLFVLTPTGQSLLRHNEGSPRFAKWWQKLEMGLTWIVKHDYPCRGSRASISRTCHRPIALSWPVINLVHTPLLTKAASQNYKSPCHCSRNSVVLCKNGRVIVGTPRAKTKSLFALLEGELPQLLLTIVTFARQGHGTSAGVSKVVIPWLRCISLCMCIDQSCSTHMICSAAVAPIPPEPVGVAPDIGTDMG